MKNSGKKRWTAAALAFLFLSGFAFAGCDNSASSGGTNNGGANNGQPTPPDGSFVNPGDRLDGGGEGTLPDTVDESETESAVIAAGKVDLSALKADTDETGATALEADGVISAAGTYLLSGDYADGVSFSGLKKGAEVHLILSGANISSAAGAAIAKSDKKLSLTVTAKDGTTNAITTTCDGANAVHVKGDLYVNGGGTLEITTSGADGSAVKASGKCFIVNAALNLSCTKHGVSAETVAADGATINVKTAAKDGLHAECDYDNSDGDTSGAYTTESGFVALKDVTYTCNTDGDGIQADTFAYISGGTYDIRTNGLFLGFSSANMAEYGVEADDYRYIKSGSTYKKVASDYNGNISSRYALAQSCKGIKAGEIEYDTDGDDEDDYKVTDGAYAIVIESGDVTINSTDDAVHCNGGDTFIRGGNLTIDTYDDGITSDYLTCVKGGDITVNSSYEGLEGAYVEISGGTISVVSSDDGINAASDDASVKEYILISGGDIAVNAEGDGLDSNGSILMTGGTVIVHGPTGGGDGALDSETGIIVQGGTLYAAGSLGMVETPSSNSSQYVLSYAQSSAIAAGTTITITDADGNALFETTTEKSCQSVIISLAAFVSGGSYTITLGDGTTATFTVSSVITSVGATASGGMGGQPGAGGNQPGGNRPGGFGGFGGN